MPHSHLTSIATPDWVPSIQAVIMLAIVQAGRPLDVTQLLHECRTHVQGYVPGQCSAALRRMEFEGLIYLRGGLYDITSDPMSA